MIEFIGRLHPLIVHLPIGFILFGVLLQVIDRKKAAYNNIIALAYLAAGVIALVACLTGYLLYRTEGFTYAKVMGHLWWAVATALLCFVIYAGISNKVKALAKVPNGIYGILVVLFVSITGHLGGNLTHGEDYLTEPLPASVKKILGKDLKGKEMAIKVNDSNWKETQVYPALIQPIFSNKCYSCHGERDQKGELALHTQEAIVKGGENGAVLEPMNLGKSKLYQYLILPKEDEKHMPPKDKTQLTKEEISLVEAWIAHGASFEKTVGEMKVSKDVLLPFFPKEEDNLPKEAPKNASKEKIERLKQAGFFVENVSENTTFLSVSAINSPGLTLEDLNTVLEVPNHIVYLNLSNTKINDSCMLVLAKLPNLTELDLRNTAITGKGIDTLKVCRNLQKINLSGTAFKKENFDLLTGFSNLKKVILYSTIFSDKKGTETVGKTTFEYGNYDLPFMVTDTIVY
ncbi:c-type cytochrome domain-containing protein [Galbibacter mesophilus]|uniref:c-type cytochrome domain-containing protein n=1 Tax=Galbibacter mesophilus TaxID=379069 RepID=UPI00191D45E6|nr:c-type cytochrome domain-containing protein [Galbibacter mesophilus]MCM5661796.1 hypothetical protein [Galbibacter mesophilus]